MKYDKEENLKKAEMVLREYGERIGGKKLKIPKCVAVDLIHKLCEVRKATAVWYLEILESRGAIQEDYWDIEILEEKK